MGDSDREVGATDGEGEDGEDGEDGLEGVDVEEEEASLTEAESPPRVESWTKKNRFFSVRTIGGHKKNWSSSFYRFLFKTPKSCRWLLGECEKEENRARNKQQVIVFLPKPIH